MPLSRSTSPHGEGVPNPEFLDEQARTYGALRRLDPVLQIRSRMREIGLTSAGLAERLGVSEANVSRLLRGDQNLKIDTLYRLADAVGSPLSVLLGVPSPTTDVRPDVPSNATSDGNPIVDDGAVRSAEHRSPSKQVDIQRMAQQRARLLAASYAEGDGEAQRAIMAQLEILNRRLIALSPRVSPAQMMALEDANDELARIRTAREERAKRLGSKTNR